jgi:SAM-dependent methyltransferase
MNTAPAARAIALQEPEVSLLSIPEKPDMTCIICGSGTMVPIPFDRRPEADAILARRGQKLDYQWFLCETCGNATPAYQPDIPALEEIWQINRSSAGDDAATWAERHRIARIGANRSWEMFSGLHKNPGKGRFLDIACGLGLTVKHFQDNGWAAEGNDIDATIKSIHHELGISTRIGPVENQNWKEAFDLIQIAYAIYFITDPKAYVERLQTLLKPGGHIAIVMSDHLAHTSQGGPAYMHTFIPTADSMEGLLARAGYRTVLRRKVRDTWFIAATPGDARPPQINAKAILAAHRTRAMRWKLLGANRARLRILASRLLRR